MRKLLVATIMSAGVVMQAGAANTEQYAPEMKAYLNFGFGAPQAQSLGMHYGFRMDYDQRLQIAMGHILPSMMQLDFTSTSGFSSALLNGQPFLKRVVQLNQDGDASAPAAGSAYTTMDWGLLAVGVVGIGFGISQVVKTHESPDPVTTTTTSNGAGGNVIVTTVNGVVTQVVNATTGLPIPLGTITGPLLTQLCSATATSGGLGCPKGYASAEDRALADVSEREATRHLEWLNADYGHMGDLYLQP